tara:strand:- start:141 stop:344 length:204 start_codon:yes stop_codon:yes gene_type:complete
VVTAEMAAQALTEMVVAAEAVLLDIQAEAALVVGIMSILQMLNLEAAEAAAELLTAIQQQSHQVAEA